MSERDEIDRKAMLSLSGSHLATDFAAGSVPALLPFLVLEFGLGYAAAALLLLAATVSSSLVQPLFGLWSDRVGALWLLPGGVLVAGVGVGLAAIAPSYWLILVLVFVAGIGIAAYHPEGAKFAAYASGPKRASGMAYFNIGGNSGYALGAIVTTPLVVWFGLVGGLLAVLPVIAVGVAVVRTLPHLRRLRPATDGTTRVVGENRPGAMVVLGVIIVLRSVAWFALLAFVPLWLVSLGNTEAEGNRMLSLMLLAGAVGTLALGPVADRIGLRRTLVLTQAALAPLMLVFIHVGGVAGTVALMLVGASVVGTFGVTMVMGQLYLPRHVGLASGLSVGLAMGLGGVAAVALGAVADAVDLEAALTVSALAPLLGVALCFLLPAPVPPTRVVVEPAVT